MIIGYIFKHLNITPKEVKMKSPKYAVLSFVVIVLVLVSGCDLSKKSQESLKKESPVKKEEISVLETTKRNDFGCFYSCDFFPEGYPKQMCEDWNGGKQVYWPDDCTVMQYEPCIRLCEHEKNSTKKITSSIPTNVPPSVAGFPQSPTDFFYHTRTPACADQSDHNGQLIYARPSDAPDRYIEIAPKLKQWIANANGLVNAEANRFGMTADLKIFCENGEMSVLNVVLPIKSADKIAKQQVAEALIEKGLTSEHAKYIVFWDGKMYGCGSEEAECTGAVWVNEVYEPGTKAVREILSDDKLYEDSPFNKGGDFAFVVGVDDPMLSPIILLHEYTHAMGAVQLNAPNSAGEGHCKDEPPADKSGNDVMCKSDIPGTVFGDACKDSTLSLRYDCNNDDYFNPKPEPGSYLATHWNLGSPLNKYIKFG